ncbi:hypothetical protein [Tropicimonas sp. IMCC6043]|uniref:hypothetical protein n=1 Tax=Tropicimonas sp. IMCC6043 TaxID=2510645 RepID=UPI00101D0672|nr:hypothetical protein [Tropicimonas sp. IMCC6043]RYH09600.1 hypothetical protein EU800_11665 [Tropicimonas sp. IMCC6043]
MLGLTPRIIAAVLLTQVGTNAPASVMRCERPDDPNHSYTVAGDHGDYTWNDHGIERSWSLTCNGQQGGSTACHRREQYGENGLSLMTFTMLPDGTLIQAGSLALLDVSYVSVTPGFECTNQRD